MGTRFPYDIYYTREFTFILDPSCMVKHDVGFWNSIFEYIGDLKSFEPKVDINVLMPIYNTSPEILQRISSISTTIAEIRRITVPPKDIALDPDLRDKMKEYEQSDEYSNALSLLSLSYASKADGIITQSDILVKFRYDIYHHQDIKIIPSIEFTDIIEVIARGNSIFWSVLHPNWNFTFEVFYAQVHWKCHRYYKWYFLVRDRIKNKDTQELLRIALLNRYIYILHSRDMVHFYELQREYFVRHDLPHGGLTSGYYLNMFYLMLWGMLDHLTIIAKHEKNLNISDKKCGIENDIFWKEYGVKDPGLRSFMKSEKVSAWINMMADMRHHAAHKGIKIPAEMVSHTEESQLGDEQIIAIIQREDPSLYKLCIESKEMESQVIFNWRFKKMSTVARHVVFGRDKCGRNYFWDPIISVDKDLEMLTAIVDAFIFSLFKKANSYL